MVLYKCLIHKKQIESTKSMIQFLKVMASRDKNGLSKKMYPSFEMHLASYQFKLKRMFDVS